MRLFITTLSLLSVIAFGYALAGYGGSLVGYGVKTDYIIYGLGGGILCALLALLLWYRNRKYFYDYDEHSEDL